MTIIINRFNRTLNEIMWKEFGYQATYKWINNYNELGEKYNNSFHRTINMTPNEGNLSNENLLSDTAHGSLKIHIY